MKRWRRYRRAMVFLNVHEGLHAVWLQYNWALEDLCGLPMLRVGPKVVVGLS